MRYFIIISILVLFTSCVKEKTQILSANVNGKEMQFVGTANKYHDYLNNEAFGDAYYIFSLGPTNIFIAAYDSTFVRTYFDFSHLSAKYSDVDSLGNSKSYDAINGEMSIEKEKDGIICGNFRFTFVNIYDSNDTIILKDGRYEITLDERDRTWFDDTYVP